MKKYKTLLLIAAMIIGLLSACAQSNDKPSSETEPNQSKNELILAIGGEPEEGFDPTTGWGRYGSSLFQSTLFKYDEYFNIQNDLVESYDIKDDGLVWEINIKEGIKFSDGEPLTADDIAFTYETAKTSGSIIDLSNLEHIELIDSQTVEFHLKKRESTFIYLLSTIGIVPKHAYNDTYNLNPIGSGPYRFLQWNKGQQLIVEENPHYYGDKPYFKKLTFLFLAEDAAFAAAKSGEVDIVSVPSTFAKESVAGMKLIELESVDNRGIMFPYVKSGEETKDGYPIGNDVTADIAIRKALNIAVDRQALVNGILDGFGTPAYSVADNLPWWNPDTIIQDNDIEKAKNILDESGWKENENGIREKDGLKAQITLLYPAGDQTRQSLSITFADMIKPLGIEVKTDGKSWNELETLMYSNPVMMGWGSHDPLEMYNLYSSHTRGQGFYNSNYYDNQMVDTYMENAMRANSLEEANEFWKKAQWDGTEGFSALGDAPWAWLVNLKHLYFVKDDLDIGEQRIQPHGHGWPITDFIEKWHWKAEKEG